MQSSALKVTVIPPTKHILGVMVTSPGLGILGHKVTQPDTKIISIDKGTAHFSQTIRLPLTPMVGVIGVTPSIGDIHCAVPGDHGGNMDTKVVTIGAKVYLPVAVEGAGLAVGDLHACMGDGELSGTGIETAGKIQMKTSVIKGITLKRVMIEDAESIYTVASSKTFEEGVCIATDDMVAYLQRKITARRSPRPTSWRLRTSLPLCFNVQI